MLDGLALDARMAKDVERSAERLGVRDFGAKAAQKGEYGDVAARGEIDGAAATAHDEVDARDLGEREGPQAPLDVLAGCEFEGREAVLATAGGME